MKYCNLQVAQLPSGPWKSDTDALIEIQSFAQDPNTGGGIWSVRFQASLENNGKKRRIGCSCAHSAKRRGPGSSGKIRHGADCRWGVSLKLCANGWVVGSYRPHHSHALATRPEQAPKALKFNRPESAPDTADAVRIHAPQRPPPKS